MLTVLLAVFFAYVLLVAFAVALGRASAKGDAIRAAWPEYFEAVAEYQLELIATAPVRSGRFTRQAGEREHEGVEDVHHAAAA